MRAPKFDAHSAATLVDRLRRAQLVLEKNLRYRQYLTAQGKRRTRALARVIEASFVARRERARFAPGAETQSAHTQESSESSE
jgi:hypothetical protein